MKKILTILILAALAMVFLSGCAAQEKTCRSQYVRIHIRANSDSETDQAIKLKVRDAVVACLVPILQDCETAEEAKKNLSGSLPQIEAAADSVLAESVGYRSAARLAREEFPQKSYGDLTLEAGVYDAIIVDLGSGKGANWWCVAFPPLCFVPSNEEGVEYKSKIMEIINRNKEKKEEPA